MASRFIRAYPNSDPLPETGLWFAFRKQELLVATNGAGVMLPHGNGPAPEIAAPRNTLLLGSLDGVPCLACTLDEDEDDALALPNAWRLIGLRELFDQVAAEQYAIAGYAAQMLHWQRHSAFCSVCGSPTTAVRSEWSKRCISISCGHTTYPHVSPCVIVLVYDGERVLLTHKPGWGPRYSIIAGFVEPGESLEECLAREVREEVGVEVDRCSYFGSQPWPFPHQLMVGFFARYAGGEIVIDENELDDARWFHVDDLPMTPPPLSIARQMIDAWAQAKRGA